VHDDLIMSAALIGELESLPGAFTGPTLIIPGIDPLEEMNKGF
jgi:hypothetical protein